MARLLPDYYAKSIFDVPMSFYKEQGITHVISDLDNTLDAFDVLLPSKRVVELAKKFSDNGIALIIITNNTEKRVKDYATTLNVADLYSARKPFPKKIIRFLNENEIDRSKLLLVGDQLMTDVKCAKKGNFKVMLTEPIVKKDQWTTKFNRLFDRPIRKRYLKRGLLQKLEVPYGKR